MLSIDLIQLAILWSIAGVALICALNAHGFFRILLSWLVAISIVAVAIFFSYAKSMSVKQQMGFDGLASDTTKTFVSDTTDAATQDSIMASFITIEKHLLDEAVTVSNAILAFPKWKDISAQGIEQREVFESRALSLRNKSMDIYRQIRNLNPPNEERMHYELLLAAADNLRLAGYETHSQFGQDDGSGDNLSKAMIYAAQAKAAFLQLKEQL